MIKFTSRGHEIVSSEPVELSVRLNQPPRDTIEDRIRRMVMRERMDDADTIRDEADMMEDLYDFGQDELDTDLLGPSSYEVPEDVPDAFSAEAYREAKKKKDSPKPADSGTDSAVLAGE